MLHDAMATFKSFSLKLDPSGSVSAGIDVDPTAGRGDSGYIATDISDLASDLAAAAQDNHTGVAVFIDEMQDANEDVLAALCAAVHNAAQRKLPFYVFGAGLPSLPGVLSNAATYAERMFEYRRIEHLGDADSRRVLTDPANAEGVQWEDAATTLIANEANGYPYFLQEYGRAAWDVAPGPVITHSDVLIAITDGRDALDAGFFHSRWARATPAERHYLSAMAQDGPGPSLSNEIASRLGRAIQSIGPTRANLITKGLIYAPEHGRVAYTVPGMADFVRRQDV